MKNYYYILGVKETASLDEIKSAYRKLSKKFHPDKNPGDKFFEERFKDIQEGYSTLSDSQKRKVYDDQLNEIYKNDSAEFEKRSKKKSEVEEESQFFYTLIQGTLVTAFCLCSLYAIYDILVRPLVK